MRELIARIHAVMRRTHDAVHTQPDQFVFQHLSIDFEKHLVTVSGKTVDLSLQSYLLRTLVASRQVLRREELLQTVWGQDVTSISAPWMHVRWLKRSRKTQAGRCSFRRFGAPAIVLRLARAHSIRWRLSVYQISVISLAMMAVAVLGQQSIHEYYVKRLEQHLFHQASLVRRVLLAEIDAGLDADPTRRLIAQLGEATTARLTLVDPAGNIVADSQPTVGTPTNLSVRPEIATLLHSRLPSEGQFERAIRADGMHVAIPVFQEQQLLGLVRVSLLADLHQQLRGLARCCWARVLTTILPWRSRLRHRLDREPIREVTEAAYGWPRAI